MKIKISILIMMGLISITNGQLVSNPSASLPIDESIRSGVLENGLTYYIKPISQPQAKVSMNFTVKTGFLHEEEDEYNFAHHIEHLAFRETTNFPLGLKGNSELLAELQIRSSDIGGYTGLLHTFYYFEPPSGNKKAIETGMLWFQDIASGIDLSRRSIDRERGVLLQEITSGSSAKDNSLATKQLHSKLFPCRPDYQGIHDHIKKFPPQNLKEFYKKWYRPDLMAISIVGNVDNIDELEEKVKKMFAGLEPSAVEMPNVECLATYLNNDPTILNKQPGFALINSDSEHSDKNQITFHLIFRDHLFQDESNNFEYLKRKRSGKFLGNILNMRLKESLNNYGNTFNFYSGYNSEQFPSSLHVVIGANLKEEEKALTKALIILNQLIRHGVTDVELEELKQKELNRLGSVDTSDSSYWVKQIQNHFIYKEWLPTGKITKEIEWVKDLSTDELNDRLDNLIFNMPEDIGIIAPKNYHGNLTVENNIRDFIQKNLERKTEAFKPQLSKPVLMEDEEADTLSLKPVLKLKEDFHGTQKFQLSNGLTVILKPTKAASEDPSKIYLHGFSQKGAFYFSEKDYYSARYAPYVVRHSGIGQLDKFALDEFYKKKGLPPQVLPYLNSNEAGIKAQGNYEDLETLLQLVYLFFTQPRVDKAAFEDWKTVQEKFSTANDMADFSETFREVTGDFEILPNASKRIPAINEVNYDKTHRFYKKIFGNAQEFTFILVGDFASTDVVPLFQKYLGNLPNNLMRDLQPQRENMKLSSGPIHHQIPFPDSYHTVNYAYGFKFINERVYKDVWKEEIKVKALGMLLNRMLFQLRSDYGFSLYHFGAIGSYNRALNRFEISLRLKCTPEELALIKDVVFQFLNNLKTSDISVGLFETGLKDLRSIYNNARLETPRAVSEKLYRYYRYGEPPVNNTEVVDFIDSLSIEELASTAISYFKTELFHEVLMK